MKLALFDVDGTLIKSDARVKERYRTAVEKVFGLTVDISRHQTNDGKTDTGILLEVCTAAGVSLAEAERRLDDLRAAVDGWNEANIGQLNFILLPGVQILLDALKRRKVALGIVTGNLPSGVRAMLGPAGLLPLFEVQVTGDMTNVRSRLLYAAIEQAAAKNGTGRLEVSYFDDSPMSIRAAKEAGVFAVGVATGDYGEDELHAAGADAVLPNLMDIDRVLTVLGYAQSSA